MKRKYLTGKYFWTERRFGGFNLWVEIDDSSMAVGGNRFKYVKGNLADMNQLGISMNKSNG